MAKPMHRIAAVFFILLVCLGVAAVWFYRTYRSDGDWKYTQTIDGLKSGGCVQYFDGCNTCSLSSDGWQCTLMYCETPQTPYCIK